MDEYKGKVIGNQYMCCEENREVVLSFMGDTGFVLQMKCKECGRTWTEVLD